MASASCTLFSSVSHFLFLLSVTMLIQHSESCPEEYPFNFNFNCPDNVYNGPLSSSHFTNTSLRDYNCLSGPCELTCGLPNHTMINCSDDDEEPPHRVIEINPSPDNPTITIPVDGWLPPYYLKQFPCMVYLELNFSFPVFRSVSLSITGIPGENQTFLGCPFPEKGNFWDGHYSVSIHEGEQKNVIVYGPYEYGRLPSKKPLPPSCMKFQTYFSTQVIDTEEPAPPPSPPKVNRKSGILRELILSVLSVIVIIEAALIFIIIYWWRRNSKSALRPLPSSIMSLVHTRSDLEVGNINNGVTVFSYAELQQVTNNFDPSRELGEGGFGVVYHGKLDDGREVAVKRMFEKNYRQIEQFKNEIQLLTNIRHPNLVTLYGSTSRHSRELLLVYEYIPNGTLAEHLHGHQSKSVLLLWPTRLKIAIQTASALCYLHYKDIIHRDIKSNNILLDKSFVAKVADFGLSRLFPSDVSHVSTAPQGTPGYLDPEYHQCYHLTDRSDVYSFGVVLIELISSMEAVDFGRERHEVNLANYALNRIQGCQFGELVDVNLGYEKSFKVRRMTTLVAELAFRCLQHEREIRPSMEEVLEALKRIESVDYDELEDEEMG